ncbi:MAG: Mur ligase family protein [Pirellulales bacterium]|nr:Mur ligase family protein [Pirellulales bacterium]
MWHPSVPLNGLSLRELLPDADGWGERDARVTGCSTVATSCKPGDAFVVVDRVSATALQTALDQGASAVVVRSALAGHEPEDAIDDSGTSDLSVPMFRVPDPQAALSRICQALVGRPSERLKVVGVTGAHGKTTTSCLLASILGVGGLPTGVMSSLAWFDGERTTAAASPMLAPQAVAPWLARMESNGCSHAVMEIVPDVLESELLDSVQLDCLCLTGVQNNSWRFDTPADVIESLEQQVHRHLPPHGMLAINADDAGCQELLNRIQHPTLTIGIKNSAEITAEIVEQTPYDQTFLLCAGNETIPVRTRLIGTHNVYNSLAAAAISLGYGLDPIDIVRGLERVEVISNRLQRVDVGQPYNVFVDAANNSTAMEAALRALHQAATGRVICVFGCDGGGDRFARPLVGRIVEQFSDLAIVTSADPHDEHPEDILDDISDGFRGPVKPWTIEDRSDAIRAALSLAQEGDSVLIAGRDAVILEEAECGKSSYQDDREIARQILEEITPRPAPFRAAA